MSAQDKEVRLAERVFIATTGNGVMRASASTAGGFTTEPALEGTTVVSLAVDPLARHRIYAGAVGMGVLCSDDRGQSWRSAGLAGQSVMAIAASPVQRGLVYAGVRPAALFVSLDGGASWQEVAAFRRVPWRRFWFSPAGKPFTAYVQAIALSPTDSERLVIGIELGATVMSSDGGKSWSSHRRGALRDCHGLCSHLQDGNWVYEAGGTGGGAAFSRDGGRTWTNAGKGLDRHYGWAVAADCSDPSIWYVSASPGPFQAHGEKNAEAYLYRREGDQWMRLAGGLPQPLAYMPYALIAESGVSGSLFAGLSNGELWHTGDYGESWEQLPVHLGKIHRTLVLA